MALLLRWFPSYMMVPSPKQKWLHSWSVDSLGEKGIHALFILTPLPVPLYSLRNASKILKFILILHCSKLKQLVPWVYQLVIPFFFIIICIKPAGWLDETRDNLIHNFTNDQDSSHFGTLKSHFPSLWCYRELLDITRWVKHILWWTVIVEHGTICLFIQYFWVQWQWRSRFISIAVNSNSCSPESM